MTDEATTRWQRLEEYLYDHHEAGSDFSAEECAELQNMPNEEASADIQAYLEAQRKPDSRTLYVLERVPGTRTRSARWMVGERTKHARAIGAGLADDVSTTVHRAFVPDLRRIGEIKPSTKIAARQTELIDHGLALFTAAAQGADFSGDGDEE